MASQIEELFGELPHPDQLGESEYRAIYEFLHDVADSACSDGLSDEEIAQLILDSIGKLVESANFIRDRVTEFAATRLG